MPSRYIRRLGLTMVLAGAPPLGHAALAETHYDIVKDFKLKSNPNGVWTYMEAAPLPDHHHTYLGVSGIDVWSNDAAVPLDVSIAKNTTGQPISLKHGKVTFPPDYLLLNPEAGSPGAIVQFQAPIAGTYTLKGNAMGLAEHGTHQHEFSIQHIYSGGQSTLYWNHPGYMKAKRFHLHVVMAVGDALLLQIGGHTGYGLDDVGVAAKIVGP